MKLFGGEKNIPDQGKSKYKGPEEKEHGELEEYGVQGGWASEGEAGRWKQRGTQGPWRHYKGFGFHPEWDGGPLRGFKERCDRI